MPESVPSTDEEPVPAKAAASDPMLLRTPLGPPAQPLFGVSSWERPPAPRPPPVAMPPPTPVAPALPFSLAGRMDEPGAKVAILQRQDKTYVVRVGDEIDGTYRVVEIGPGSVVFLYLPLNERQVARFAT